MEMLLKTFLISLIHFCLKKGINAHGSSELNGDGLINNPTTSSAVHTSSSINPTQASVTMDPTGQPNVIANSPSTPESIKSFSNRGISEDLARSTRGALIGGFENTDIPSSLMGTQISTGAEGPPGIAEGMLLGSAVAPLPIGLAGPNPAIDVSLRADVPGQAIPGGLINPGLFVGMPAEPLPSGFLNTPVVNTGGLPGMPTIITSNTVLTNSITNGLTTPLYGGVAQVGANGLSNPGMISNNLPNAGLHSALLTPTLSGPVNSLTTVGMSPNTFPATFPARSFSGSKSILASLTGIDPASLRTNAKFTVKSSSPMSPTGLTVQAENLLMQGKLAVTGQMPFLGSVTVDGVVPDGGTGTVMYECGNGNLGMVSEVNTAPVGMGTLNNVGRSGINPVNSVSHINSGFTSVYPNILSLRNSLF